MMVKLKGKTKKKSLNCVFGCRSNNAALHKAFQDENIPPYAPPSDVLLQRFLKQSVEMAATPSKRPQSAMSAHLTDSQIDLSVADEACSSLLFQSKQYTPKPKSFMQRYTVADGQSPSEFIRSQMSEKGSEIHQWLDGVSVHDLRKDGSYSNSGTSPEVSPEQTLLQTTTASVRLISEDNLRWDPGISLIPGSADATHTSCMSDDVEDDGFAELDNAYLSGPLDAAGQTTLLHDVSLPSDASSMSDHEVRLRQLSMMQCSGVCILSSLGICSERWR
jgi:hypothetical protein